MILFYSNALPFDHIYVFLSVFFYDSAIIGTPNRLVYVSFM